MNAQSSKGGEVEPVSSSPPSLIRTPRARSVGPGGGQRSAPAARSGIRAFAAAFARNPWFPVAARTAAVFAGMIGLSIIGARATLAGSGVKVALAESSAAPAPSGVWVAPSPPIAAASAAPLPPPPPQAGAGVTTDGKVILNLATADELTKLPRVGAKRAQAILDLRHKLGKFRRPTDLLRVRGIGRKTLKQMLPLLVLDSPAAP